MLRHKFESETRMTLKEKKKSEAFSRWYHGSRFIYDYRLPRSHFLQNNLFEEYEEKINAIVSIIEEDGDTFSKRAEVYYEQRPQLLKLVDDLHRSYACLARNYDQLRSHIPTMSSSSAMIRPLRTSESSRKQREEEMPRTAFERESSGDDHCEEDKAWSEKRMSELIEDHVRCQTELVSQNEAKRDKIRELRLQVQKLMEENKALKASVSSTCCVKPVNQSNGKPRGTLCLFKNLSGCAG